MRHKDLWGNLSENEYKRRSALYQIGIAERHLRLADFSADDDLFAEKVDRTFKELNAAKRRLYRMGRKNA